MSADEVRTILIAVAIGISFASLYFSRKSWLQTNRPIITAFVIEHNPDGDTTVFNLVVSNTGNRPATCIKLHASKQDILKLVEKDAENGRKQSIAACFSDDAAIPLLRNDEELKTAFGAFSGQPTNGAWLNYGVEINISITYFDLDGRNYKSEMPLKIYVRNGFGGHVWT